MKITGEQERTGDLSSVHLHSRPGAGWVTLYSKADRQTGEHLQRRPLKRPEGRRPFRTVMGKAPRHDQGRRALDLVLARKAREFAKNTREDGREKSKKGRRREKREA